MPTKYFDEEIIVYSKPLFRKQYDIVKNILKQNKKYNIINASRQAGKTTLLSQVLLYWSLNKANTKCLYVSPTYTLGKTEYRKMVDGLQNSTIVKENNKTDLYIKFYNNSEIVYRSATNYDNIRGGSYDYVVVDEFSYIDREAWESVIRQTLNVQGKQAILVSTPRGRNLFWELAIRGQRKEDNYTYNFLHYSDNPFYNLEEVQDAKRTLPETIFQQEYEGLFLEDGGSVFRNITEVCILDKFSTTGSKFYAGLDIGRVQDYTVLTILNEFGEVVEIYRMNLKDWRFIIDDVVRILKKWNARCLMEVNSLGSPIYEQILLQYNKVDPFTTSVLTKNELIENLIMAFNDKILKLPTKKLFPELYNELQTFSFKYNSNTQRIQYQAINGFHDDTIISVALAYKALKDLKNKGQFNYSFI